MSIKRNILLRLNIVFVLLCVICSLILGQAFKIQFIEGDEWRELAKNSTRIDTIEGERGNMYSEDGRLLATSLPVFDIRFDTKIVADSIFNAEVDSLSWHLANHFKDKNAAQYKSILQEARKDGNRYLLVKREVTYNDLQEVKTWPIFRYKKFKGGFISKQTNKRITPFSILARRTVGYVRENAQSVGLEGSFDHYLRGDEMAMSMHRTSDSRWVPINDDYELDARNGNDLYTNIDINLQDIAHNALLNSLQENKANHGCVIVMEVKTGKIKAIANLGVGSDSTTYWEKYNYAIGKKSEPGSTFKVATLTALLDQDLVDENTIVDIEEGQKQFYDKVMRDASWSPYNEITLKKVMEISSNVGISKLADEFYGENPNEFIRLLAQMHLTKKTGIEIKGEPDPTIKTPEDSDWTGITIPWMTIGYELELTPLQLLTFFNGIANDGTIMKPYLVSEVKELNRTIRKFRPQVLAKDICKPTTAQRVRKILQGIVEEGTARNILSDNFSMAGKTGTAKIAKDKQGYDKVYQASFAGFFPAENPAYSCIVVINEPSGESYYGSTVAAPVFKEIVEKFYASDIKYHEPINKNTKKLQLAAIPLAKNGNQNDLLSIYQTLGINHAAKSNSYWVEPKENNDVVNLQPIKLIENLVPRVEDMGLRDAMFILENQGYKVQFKGYGKVIYQQPQYGERLEKGGVVNLELQ